MSISFLAGCLPHGGSSTPRADARQAAERERRRELERNAKTPRIPEPPKHWTEEP